jgi:glycosyltransferase involved in cell wall biosynthesis
LSAVLVMCTYLFFWFPTRLTVNEGAVTSQALQWEGLSFARWIVRWIYPHTQAIIVPTHACKKDLVVHFSIDEKTISVIPNWTLFRPTSPLAPRFDCLYVGRFDPEKNPLFMIKLAKMLLPTYPNLRIGMVGHGSLGDHIIETMQKEKLSRHINMLSFSSHVEDVIRRSRLLVVPSWNEGMPNVVLEAAMCQIPAVVNHFLGAEEVVVHGKTGFISETDKQAAEYIHMLLGHNRERISMGRRAQVYVQKHFADVNQKQFINKLLFF